MAERPVFISKNTFPFYEERNTMFMFHSGFAVSQKQRNIVDLHRAFIDNNPGWSVLEVSSKSTELIGVKLSAFNVPYVLNGKEVSLESIFQGSKVFEKGGPYHDLYDKGPVEAKKDQRIRESGHIIGFSLDGTSFPSEPKDYFYNWIYSSAIYNRKDLISQLLRFNAFTDIEFNPKKSLNCQARTVAIVRGLIEAGVLDETMKSPEAYLELVYKVNKEYKQPKQMSLFD